MIQKSIVACEQCWETHRESWISCYNNSRAKRERVFLGKGALKGFHDRVARELYIYADDWRHCLNCVAPAVLLTWKMCEILNCNREVYTPMLVAVVYIKGSTTVRVQGGFSLHCLHSSHYNHDNSRIRISEIPRADMAVLTIGLGLAEEDGAGSGMIRRIVLHWQIWKWRTENSLTNSDQVWDLIKSFSWKDEKEQPGYILVQYKSDSESVYRLFSSSTSL